MILTFADKQTQALSEGRAVRKFASFERIARRKLRQLEIAGRLEDLRIPPGNRLERLKGDRAGQMSIRALTTSGECASDGHLLGPRMLRLLIIIRHRKGNLYGYQDSKAQF